MHDFALGAATAAAHVHADISKGEAASPGALKHDLLDVRSRFFTATMEAM